MFHTSPPLVTIFYSFSVCSTSLNSMYKWDHATFFSFCVWLNSLKMSSGFYIYYICVLKKYPHPRTCLLIFVECDFGVGGRLGRDTYTSISVREQRRLVCALTRDQTLNLGMCPDQGFATFWCKSYHAECSLAACCCDTWPEYLCWTKQVFINKVPLWGALRTLLLCFCVFRLF